MRTKIKYEIIYRHREEYPVSVMCRYFGVSKSGYYDYVKRIGRVEKDAQLAEKIRQHQEHCFQTYGYRRMHIWLGTQGIHHDPKTILQVMKKYGLLAEIRRRRKWQNLGQQIHRYENLLDRQFTADRLNSKWVTDISYIHTGEGVLYLSMIRDLYDNSIVAYKTAASQTVNLVLDTLRLAMRREKKKVAGQLQLHSDQGFQYTSQAYFKLTRSYKITPSIKQSNSIPLIITNPSSFFNDSQPTNAVSSTSVVFDKNTMLIIKKLRLVEKQRPWATTELLNPSIHFSNFITHKTHHLPGCLYSY